VYAQVRSHEFLVCDDDMYVTDNPIIRLGLTWKGFLWAFEKPHVGNYHPLTWLSHMSDVECFGLAPGPHHLVNVVLHAATSIMLLMVLRFMTGRFWPPVIAAFLFALHPLRVESVAWVAERKDVLCGLFWMATMLSYVWYVQATHSPPSLTTSRIRTYLVTGSRYLLVVFFFTCALLSKSMAVTLPCVLFLCDFWPLARQTPAEKRHDSLFTNAWRTGKLLLEKVPLLLIAAWTCWMTVQGQSSAGAVNTLEAIPMDSRITNALVTYVAYLVKTMAPGGLSIFYPHFYVLDQELPSGLVIQAVLAGIFLSGITITAFATARRWPFFLVGWLWYLGTLVPVIGLVQVGTQSMADRYTYLPSIGICIIVVWGLCELTEKTSQRHLSNAMVSVAVILALTLLSWQYTQRWKNNFDLFEHAVRVTDRNYFAYNHIGLAYDAIQDSEQARKAFERAIELNPNYDFAHNNLAVFFARTSNFERALQHLTIAVGVNPHYVDAHSNLAVTYEMLGQFEKAEQYQLKAIELQPDRADSHFNLGIVYQKIKRWEQAAACFETAIRLNPSHARAYHSLGLMQYELREEEQAVESLRRAIHIDPNYPQALNALGLLYQEQQDWAQAKQYFEESLRIQPDQPQIQQLWRDIKRRAPGQPKN